MPKNKRLDPAKDWWRTGRVDRPKIGAVRRAVRATVMQVDPQQHRAIIGGIWLIGFGLLFATRLWWPGIMFLIGVTAVIEGWLNRQPWYGSQAGLWCIFIGLWALVRFNIAFLFVALGVSTIVGALVKPNPFAKPKPFADHTLE
jgi:hypothetical protein